MKKLLLILSVILTQTQVFGQDSFDGKVREIIKYIERNMNPSDFETTNVFVEFFVYDFSLDSTGNIASAKTLFLDSLSLSSRLQIQKIATFLKSTYTFPKSTYWKLLVPVIIVHSRYDRDATPNDEAIFKTAHSFEILSKTQFKDVFISKCIVVQQIE